MSLVTPYTFVPLSPWVFQPERGERISQDIPFKDGARGTIHIKIRAHTPVLCGGERTTDRYSYNVNGRQCRGVFNEVNFFKLPDGRYAIPGYSQRGMLRSILEIAGFGRLQFFDDRKFSLRDLTKGAQHIYGKRLLDSSGAKPAQVNVKVQAGWMRFDRASKRWHVRPCKFARVDLNEIAALSGTCVDDWTNREDIKKRYKRWEVSSSPLRCLDVQLWVHHAQWHEHGRRRPDGRPAPEREWVDICYSKATRNNPGSNATKCDGRIVFTGKPQSGRGPRKKKQEFFFYGTAGTDLEVPQDVFTAFQEIHDPKGGDINPSWEYWQKRLERNTSVEIPVFFIEGPGNSVEAFGLAMMFKLPHSKSVAEILDNTRFAGQKHSDHRKEDLIDLADAIFGRKALRKGKGEQRAKGGLKGRVSFEPAIAEREPRPIVLGPTVLSSPQGKFYAAYIKQPRDPNNPNRLASDGGKQRYASYTPVDADPDGTAITREEVTTPELAGRKLYPARGLSAENIAGNLPPITAVHKKGRDNRPDWNQPHQLGVVLKPLPEQTEFTGRLHFHNLRQFELGAVLWALTLGNNRDLRHKMGIGRPLGLGEVSIEITGLEITWNSFCEETRDHAALVKDLVDGFERDMNEAYCAAKKEHAESVWAANWRESAQIKTLLAAADPKIGKNKNLAYMELKEFPNVKKQGFVLPPYLDDPSSSQAAGNPPPFPQGQNRHGNRASTSSQGAAPAPIRAHDTVRAKDDGDFGEVISLEGEQALVRFGSSEEWVPLDDLERVGG